LSSLLTDLDELILRCRDDKAKTYIAEAVASYRSGAFRSAIVVSWIAVCFDVIEKLRELALAGDKEAEKQVEDLEKTRKSGDLARALKFERDLLELARDKFELISHLEFIDLARLRDDRNRCAHPSLISEDQAYAPSAELTRVHIHSAVSHLLQHPPVQGKYALERLIGEVDSEYFPTDVEEARTFFTSGPLRRPRESLVRNLVLLLVKRILKDSLDGKPRRRAIAALRAVAVLHPRQFGQTLAEKLSAVFRSVDDVDLLQSVDFLGRVPDCWQYLDADVRQRLQNYVAALPAQHLEEVERILGIVPLRDFAERRIKGATRSELKEAMSFEVPTIFIDQFITIYLESTSFEQANECAKRLLFVASNFSSDQVRRIVMNAAQNSQVLESFELDRLLNALRAREKLSVGEFDQLLAQHGLSQFLDTPPQQS
jgi:hypothetical protein